MYYDQKESGKRIAALRKEKGLTQEQLAEKLNISTSTLGKIERGIQGFSIVQLEQIRTIDKRRIDNYLGKVTPREMVAIEKALSVSLAMEQLKKRSTKHKPKKEKE